MMDAEDLLKLKEPVTIFNSRSLSGAVISGTSQHIDGETRGSAVFQIKIAHRNSAWDWVWKKRDFGATDEEREQLQDWPGIHDGDPVTLGHLKQLGISVSR